MATRRACRMVSRRYRTSHARVRATIQRCWPSFVVGSTPLRASDTSGVMCPTTPDSNSGGEISC